MKKPVVDYIMKTPVYTIDEKKTGKEAIEEMESKGVKKILVTKDEEPVGVLEKWKITDIDMNRPISNLELSPFQKVPLGTEISAVESLLKQQFAAVYVEDSKDPSAKKLVGVVTAYDLAYAA